MSLQLKVQSDNVRLALESAPRIVNSEVVNSMREIGVGWERSVKQRFKGGGKGASGGKDLYSRTGALRRSVRFKLNRGARTLHMLVGDAATPYANIQEDGGTVRPKRKKFLTIPLDNAKTASGALSGSYKIRRDGRGFKTDKGPTFIYKSKAGNLIVAVKRNNRKKIDLRRDSLYVLKKSVTIKARLGAWDAARLNGPRGKEIKHELDSGIVRALRLISAKGKL